MRRLAAVLLVAVAVASALGGCSKKKHNSAVSTTTTSAPPATTTTAGSAKAFVPAIPGGTTNTTVINCQPVPARSTVPAPDGLPSLPAGSRWFEASDQSGVKVYASAAPESLPQLQSRAVKTWKAEGWQELFGESEPGREIEGVFRKGTTRIGFRARNIFCDEAWTEVRMSVASQ